MTMLEIKDTIECSCAKCQAQCKNPGWFSPDEAKAAILGGYAGRLMRDWLEPCSEVGNDDRIYLLCPASFGREGDDAPELNFIDALFIVGSFEKGRCVLQSVDGKCSIHSSGFKPLQCRAGRGCVPAPSIEEMEWNNYQVAQLWNNPEAQQLVEEWRRNFEEDES